MKARLSPKFRRVLETEIRRLMEQSTATDRAQQQLEQRLHRVFDQYDAASNSLSSLLDSYRALHRKMDRGWEEGQVNSVARELGTAVSHALRGGTFIEDAIELAARRKPRA